MSELALFNNECKTVFGLNGFDEDSATYALGWTLNKSPTLLNLFLSNIFVSLPFDVEKVSIDLQKSDGKSFTDIEIKQQSVFHIIVEAKKGWVLPGNEQLEKYRSRFDADDGNYVEASRVFVSMSAASEEYASRRLDGDIGGYPLTHLSWKSVVGLIEKAGSTTKSVTEKLWLGECQEHLKGYISMTNPTSNLAYCVVLSKNCVGEGEYTWVDVVEKDLSYFHPVGIKGWPVNPPNYIAFRKDGALMSVHRINEYKVVSNVREENDNWPVTEGDHFVYKLGSPMKPEKPLKNGKIYATGRVWCALDTLLSGDYASIADARDETQRRG
ncbi:hypothetical protein BCS58_08010 [Enterovibrio norvegicus]|uniref:hypothetical protein n=1 Tax=Enterovibrio norvegicus TaxID=188144 RepID=UPI0038999EEB